MRDMATRISNLDRDQLLEFAQYQKDNPSVLKSKFNQLNNVAQYLQWQISIHNAPNPHVADQIVFYNHDQSQTSLVEAVHDERKQFIENDIDNTFKKFFYMHCAQSHLHISRSSMQNCSIVLDDIGNIRPCYVRLNYDNEANVPNENTRKRCHENDDPNNQVVKIKFIPNGSVPLIDITNMQTI